jgi:glutamate carboxypeptidase
MPLPGDLSSVAFERALALLEELTSISSASGEAPGLERMAARLGEELGRRGFTVTIDHPPGAEGMPLPVLQANGPAAGERPLLLIGHFDTVLPAAVPRRAGDRLLATGAIDMKGGLVAFLAALDLLAGRAVAPPRDLRLVAVPDEETNGLLAHQAIVRHGPEARALWVLEPGEPAAEGETLVGGRRGMFSWRLVARGRSAHSGLHFWQGRSALAAAAEWTARAVALSRPAGGPTINAARLVGGDSGFVDDLAREAPVVGTARQLNVVPDRAIVEGEARFLGAGERQPLAAALRDLATTVAERHEVDFDFSADEGVPPVDPRAAGRQLAERAVEHAARRGWQLVVEEDRGGISFPNFLADPARIPILDGLGPVGGGMHTREEHVLLESFARRIVLLADLLEDEATKAQP